MHQRWFRGELWVYEQVAEREAFIGAGEAP